MPRKHKWQQIADNLREQILNDRLKPGQEFPTTKELMIMFDTHVNTVQQAVNRLIAEGLVISSGSGSSKRIVARPPIRSTRSCGFPEDAGAAGRQEILELRLISSRQDLPDAVLKATGTPVLLYKTRQWRDGVAVAISEAYLPRPLPLERFLVELQSPSVSLYNLMRNYGFDPNICRETLIAAPATPEEQEILNMPQYSAWPVVHITRLVYDPEGSLLEYCLLLDRADSYEFSYEFVLSKPEQKSVGLLVAETSPAYAGNGNDQKKWYLEDRHDADFLCRLLSENVIKPTIHGQALTREQKEGLIKFIKSNSKILSAFNDDQELPEEYAAHDEGEKPFDLKREPEVAALIKTSDIISEMLHRYLKEMEKIELS